MRRTVCLLAAMLILPAVGSDSPKDYNDRMEEVSIEGTWLMVRLEANGSTIPIRPNEIYTYQGSNFHCADGELDGTYSVDGSVRPARLVEHVMKGIETCENIFQVEGDTLRSRFPCNRQELSAKALDKKKALS